MKALMYLLLGAAIGAAIALLFAPKSGADLRAAIQSTAEQDKAKLQEEWQTAKTKTQDRLDQMQAGRKQAGEQAPDEEGAAA